MAPTRTSAALPHILAIMLLGCGVLLGGGGSPAPLAEALLQIIAAIIAATLILTAPAQTPTQAPFLRLRDPVCSMALLILILPILQLIPLPAPIWQALPGREAERAALALIGAENSWRSWSMLTYRTLAALLAISPPVLLMVLTASMPLRWQKRMVAVIAALGFLALIVGTGQLASGTGSILRFYSDKLPYLLGFQANHNSAADILLITLLAMTASAEIWASGRRQPPKQLPFLLGILATSLVLMLGITLTASRAGIALIPTAIIGQLMILHRHFRINRRTIIRAVLALIAMVGLLWLLLHNNLAIARVLVRFDFTGEFRPEIWKDAAVALQNYWPAGAGMGTFIPVFMAAERLEVIDPMVANRAHNDFLEFAIEGGLPALLIMLAVCVMLCRAGYRAWHQASPAAQALARFAVATLVIIALHSSVDYPLRSMALSCLAAVAVGLLLPPAGRGLAVSDKTAKVEG
jgi:exopolysaccharide production protein ExoQ